MSYEFDIGSDSAGKIRIIAFGRQDQAGAYLPSAARAHGGPMWSYTKAAVEAAPSADSDSEGLFWASMDDAEHALTAVRGV